MPQATFAYGAGEPERAPDRTMAPSLSIFADRAHLRRQVHEDAHAAGFSVAHAAGTAALRDDPARPLGDIVVLDCPEAGPGELAMMARLDERAARADMRLIVSTTVAGLDDVFACMDRSAPAILVDPSRAERMIALGEANAGRGGAVVRELSDEDRLLMLRLSEQVGRIAQRLDGLAPSSPPSSPSTDDRDDTVRSPESAFRFGSAHQPTVTGAGIDPGAPIGSPLRLPTGGRGEDAAALPDPRLVRRVIRQRQLRSRFLDAGLFADPAWDMLLDLTAAAAEAVRVSVTSLCIASGVPPTTALRWIGQMTEAGLLCRVEDRADRRRAFVGLTDRSRQAMSAYFAEVCPDTAPT